MAAISKQLLVDAVRLVEQMSFSERERLADEVHAQQPNLLLSVLALQQYGASLAQMEEVLNLVLVFYSAMKMSGKDWPVISDDTQDRGMKRITARLRFIERLPLQQRHKANRDAIVGHSEQQILAYAYGKLNEHGPTDINTEVQQMIVLVTLNLVECIALTAPKTGARRR